MKKKEICWFMLSMILAIVYGFFIYGLIKIVFVDKTYQVLAAFVFSAIAAFPITVISDAVCNYLCQGNIKNLLKNTFNKSFIFGYLFGFIIGLIIIYFGTVVIKAIFG